MLYHMVVSDLYGAGCPSGARQGVQATRPAILQEVVALVQRRYQQIGDLGLLALHQHVASAARQLVRQALGGHHADKLGRRLLAGHAAERLHREALDRQEARVAVEDDPVQHVQHRRRLGRGGGRRREALDVEGRAEHLLTWL